MTLHIQRLEAENYKRIKAVTITPEGNLVFIGGRNAQGKSSVLDAMWAALAGGEASRATTQPIRDGQDMAVVRLDLGEYIITRRWTDDDAGTLTVETPPTAQGHKQRFSSPQKLLDELVGKRAFDPLAFTRMSTAEQVAALLATVELPFNPAELDRERLGVYEQRTETNRAVRQLEGQLAGIPEPAADTPESETSAVDVIAEYEAARAHNARGDELVERASRALAHSDRVGEEVADLERKLAESRRALDLAAKASALATDEATAFERVDTDAINVKLSGIEAANQRVRAAQEHRRVAAALASRREDAAALTSRIAEIDQSKAEALAAVQFPVEGLSFDDNGVLFNGIVLSQASSAEQLRVSAAIAMATHPELRVMQVKDGSLLDTDSLRILGELAEANDYQVWVEVVDESGSVGVVIEDGQVRA